MSILKSIKTTKCPICECTEIIREELKTNRGYSDTPEIFQHISGWRHEYRQFLCGYEIEFDHNEHKTEYSECCYDPKVIAKKQKEKEDKEKVNKLLHDNNINKELIEEINRYCL